jgi:hypothetical protein
MPGVCCCAGGGGGGNGGGGGAGGLIFRPSYPVTPGATYAVVVGDGGTGGEFTGEFPTASTSGRNSAFGTDPALVAIGGGGGASSDFASALNGGSGGGGAPGFNVASQVGGLGTPGQGGRPDRRWHTPAYSCSFIPCVIMVLILMILML